MRSRRALPLLFALALACARRLPELHVESATVTFAGDPAAAGRLEVAARFARLPIDPDRPVRLDVDGGARWVRLARVAGAGRVWSVDGGEHGYRLTLDLDASRMTAMEPASVPRDANPLLVGLAQDGRASCTEIRFDARGSRWTFDEARDPQGACVGGQPPAPAGELPPPRW